MKTVHAEKNFKAVVHEKNVRPIKIGHIQYNMRPDELHLIPDGSITNEPSFAFVVTDNLNRRFVVQISEAMLQRGLDALRRASGLGLCPTSPTYYQ